MLDRLDLRIGYLFRTYALTSPDLIQKIGPANYPA
jgi:hypothetical protein